MLTSLVLLALSAYEASAFPARLSEAFLQKRNADPVQVDSPCPHMAKMAKFAKRQYPGSTPPFNASLQYVSNQGLHQFVPPGPTDQRGPCKCPHIKFKEKPPDPCF